MKKVPLVLEYLLDFARVKYVACPISYQVRQRTDTVVTN